MRPQKSTAPHWRSFSIQKWGSAEAIPSGIWGVAVAAAWQHAGQPGLELALELGTVPVGFPTTQVMAIHLRVWLGDTLWAAQSKDGSFLAEVFAFPSRHEQPGKKNPKSCPLPRAWGLGTAGAGSGGQLPPKPQIPTLEELPSVRWKPGAARG